jgi:hypothetical protein
MVYNLVASAGELKDKDNNESTFEPRFTYPIFGQEEQIFGYEGLQINVGIDLFTVTLIKY